LAAEEALWRYPKDVPYWFCILDTTHCDGCVLHNDEDAELCDLINNAIPYNGLTEHDKELIVDATRKILDKLSETIRVEEDDTVAKDKSYKLFRYLREQGVSEKVALEIALYSITAFKNERTNDK